MARSCCATSKAAPANRPPVTWAVRLVRSRVDWLRGRRHLGDRLTRRGLGLPATLLPAARVLPALHSGLAAQALLVDSTTRAAMQIAARAR